MATPEMPKAGDVVGGFELTAVLSEVGYGTIYEAARTSDGMRAAVTALTPEVADAAPAAREAFESAAKIAVDIDHAHIVPILETGQTDGGVSWIATELLSGRPLAAVIDEMGHLDGKRAQRLGIQILSALSTLHDKGLVHGGLNPNAVIVTETGAGADHVKILAFGTEARLRNAEGGDKAVPLTLSTTVYAAPEQIQGDQVVPATDVYIFGLLLLEMLEGSSAIKASDLEDAKQKQLERIRLPGWIARTPFASILARCFQKKPEKRFGSAADLRAAIERLRVDRVSKSAPKSSLGGAPAKKPSIDDLRARLLGKSKKGPLGARAPEPGSKETIHTKQTTKHDAIDGPSDDSTIPVPTSLLPRPDKKPKPPPEPENVEEAEEEVPEAPTMLVDMATLKKESAEGSVDDHQPATAEVDLSAIAAASAPPPPPPSAPPAAKDDASATAADDDEDGAEGDELTSTAAIPSPVVGEAELPEPAAAIVTGESPILDPNDLVNAQETAQVAAPNSGDHESVSLENLAKTASGVHEVPEQEPPEEGTAAAIVSGETRDEVSVDLAAVPAEEEGSRKWLVAALVLVGIGLAILAAMSLGGGGEAEPAKEAEAEAAEPDSSATDEVGDETGEAREEGEDDEFAMEDGDDEGDGDDGETAEDDEMVDGEMGEDGEMAVDGEMDADGDMAIDGETAEDATDELPEMLAYSLVTTPTGASASLGGEVLCESTPCDVEIAKSAEPIEILFALAGHDELIHPVTPSEAGAVDVSLVASAAAVAEATPEGSPTDAAMVADEAPKKKKKKRKKKRRKKKKKKKDPFKAKVLD